MAKIIVDGKSINVEGNFIHALAGHPNTLKQDINIPENRALTTKPELGRTINIVNPTPEVKVVESDDHGFVITKSNNQDYNNKKFVYSKKSGSLISKSTEYSPTQDIECGVWVHKVEDDTWYIVYINEDWFKVSTVFVDPSTWTKKSIIDVHNTEMLSFYGSGTYYHKDEDKLGSIRGPQNGVTWS